MDCTSKQTGKRLERIEPVHCGIMAKCIYFNVRTGTIKRIKWSETKRSADKVRRRDVITIAPLPSTDCDCRARPSHEVGQRE